MGKSANGKIDVNVIIVNTYNYVLWLTMNDRVLFAIYYKYILQIIWGQIVIADSDSC